MSRHRTLAATAVAIYVGLTVEITDNRRRSLVSLPLLPLTGLLRLLWLALLLARRHWARARQQTHQVGQRLRLAWLVAGISFSALKFGLTGV